MSPIELAELQDAGIDWSLLGFDADELAELLALDTPRRTACDRSRNERRASPGAACQGLAGEAGVEPGLTDPDEVAFSVVAGGPTRIDVSPRVTWRAGERIQRSASCPPSRSQRP